MSRLLDAFGCWREILVSVCTTGRAIRRTPETLSFGSAFGVLTTSTKLDLNGRSPERQLIRPNPPIARQINFGRSGGLGGYSSQDPSVLRFQHPSPPPPQCSLLPYALPSALIASAASVSATPSLTLKTSISDVNVNGLENLKVTTTVTNTGDGTLKLLNDPRGVLNTFPENTFNITNPAGSRPSFHGAKVNQRSCFLS